MTSWEVVLWGNTHSLGSSTGKIPAIVYKTWNLFKQSFGFVSSLLLTFCELPPFNHKSQTHTIRLTDTSGNIEFGLEHMHTFISVSSYRDLYSGTKPFSLHLGLFRFVDKSGRIFYDLIFFIFKFYFSYHIYGFNSGCAFTV